MTGHLLYGKYRHEKSASAATKIWKTDDPSLSDPFNRFVHLVFTLDNGYHVAFSDMRKFATVKLISDKEALKNEFAEVGPEPLENDFDWKTLKACLLRKPHGHIKTVLMDVNTVAGIGNIYSDEILWASKIHPKRLIEEISDPEFKTILKNTKELLAKGIDFGGDSMSDYRNPYGERGKFQMHHRVYQRKNQKCLRKGCKGIIMRNVIGARSAHFCPVCQK